MALPDRHRSNQGFTLVEIALVMVVIGLLVGLGAALIGPLTDRAKLAENRETVKTAYQAILGFAASNKRLPANLTVLGIKTSDAFGNNLFYYPDPALTVAGVNLCTTAGGFIVNDSSSGTLSTKNNVSFILLGSGRNITNDTGTVPPFAIGPQSDVYDDIVQYADIEQLRSQICTSFRVTTDSLPIGTEEQAYPATTLQATDGTARIAPPIPYLWAITNGALPAGLTLNDNGTISGTPTVDGSYTITVQATDNEARNASKALSITINPNKPRITTEFLTYGVVNAVYPATTLSATGGLPPYTWTAVNNIAPGINLNSAGAIAGTPTAAGTYAFVATATDARGRVATKNLSIAIMLEGGGSSSTSTSSTSSSSSSSGGAAPSCTLVLNPPKPSNILVSGETAGFDWSIANGPAYAAFSPTSGTCTTFANSTAGSCSTAALTNTSTTTPRTYTFNLYVTNAAGSGSCLSLIYVGKANYRVYNDTGATYRFRVAGTCRSVANNGEITTTSLRLLPNQQITRYLSTDTTCSGAVQASISYTTAVLVDSDNDQLVNFTGTDR
jgi:prepilin-type N-terminal cleavage/methylation domain-containing protein